MVTRRRVEVTQVVAVTVDEEKFTPEFMAQFQMMMFPFDSIDDHLTHLAQLYARGIVDEGSFIEGYGPAEEMGIKFESIGGDQEIVA